MTLDGLTLAACTNELQRLITGAKVQKVLMPGREEIVLQLFSPENGHLRLCVSADAGDCAIYLTESQKPNPKTPPAFCMLLRKHLTNSRIARIEQDGLNRVVHITFDARDEMMHTITLTLTVEIMGKYSNIMLLNGAGRIIDSIKRVSVDLSSLRQVLPGAAYEPPPQKKYNPLALSEVSMKELLLPKKGSPLIKHITDVFDGISTQTATEILYRAGIETENAAELSEKQVGRLASVMRSFLGSAVSSPEPCVQLNADGLPVFFSTVPYETYPEKSRRVFESCNKMLDYYYGSRLEFFRICQQRDSLARTIRQLLSKTEKKIHTYEGSIGDLKKADKLQRRADLITANLYRLKKGMLSFEASDYETGEPVTVELDSSLTPQELSQKLYKKIGKLKTAAKMNEAKLEDSLDEQGFLLGTLYYTENARQTEDIEDIRQSLQKAGYLSPPPKSKKQEECESRPLKYTSPSGYTILVGRNDRQNDIITMRLASKDDIWFHAQKIPGSHVLLKTEGTPLDDIDDDTVVMAAQLAAGHSRARQSGKTPVDYTQRRNVKKPPGGRPGKVIYDDYFTVYVDASIE